ncbi:MAG: hypothetical protein QGG67_06610 [Gammaproteobacteria bacterium]|jgi:predicted dienelactone hydrolase|nr:hypothetical protein [Gammaproteobacteria bacterium]HJO12371.1 hypothetical protein [Gammaproteobacteria bacterium]
MKYPSTGIALLLISLLWPSYVQSQEQLPELGSTATTSGQSSAARFFGGVQVNGGTDYVSSVSPQDLITASIEIEVAPTDVDETGNLYLVAMLGGDYFMGTADGAFIPWNLTLDQLQPMVAGKTLAAREVLTALDNFPVASVDIADISLSFVPAYSTATDPGTIIYSQQPLQLDIETYEPLRIADSGVVTLDTMVSDEGREREIPVFIYLPQSKTPRPVILFSHGLGGSRFAATYLGEHWVRRGFVGVFMQHPGSDRSILDGVPGSQILAVMTEAASSANTVARIEDVSAVLDRLEAWNEDAQSPLHGRLDLEHVGMSGHSYGARTTQLVSGQNSGAFNVQEPRIDAALILSPSAPDNTEAAFGAVELPWLLMTGTKDTAIIGDTTLEDRVAVYPALPPGGKYELVLFNGEHHAFSDGNLNASQSPRNPAHHPLIMALSTAFWEAWLLGYDGARRWPDGESARAMLQEGDSWQFK